MNIVHEPDDKYRCLYWLIRQKLLTKRELILVYLVSIRISTEPVHLRQLDDVIHVGSEIGSLLNFSPGSF